MRTAHQPEAEEEVDPIQQQRPVNALSVGARGNKVRSPPPDDGLHGEQEMGAHLAAEVEVDLGRGTPRQLLQLPIRQHDHFWICRPAMKCEQRNKGRYTFITYPLVYPRGMILGYPEISTPNI